MVSCMITAWKNSREWPWETSSSRKTLASASGCSLLDLRTSMRTSASGDGDEESRGGEGVRAPSAGNGDGNVTLDAVSELELLRAGEGDWPIGGGNAGAGAADGSWVPPSGSSAGASCCTGGIGAGAGRSSGAGGGAGGGDAGVGAASGEVGAGAAEGGAPGSSQDWIQSRSVEATFMDEPSPDCVMLPMFMTLCVETSGGRGESARAGEESGEGNARDHVGVGLTTVPTVRAGGHAESRLIAAPGA